ncbi:MAG: glycosyltransferase family 4 protein [Gaiellaceae bacterium]
MIVTNESYREAIRERTSAEDEDITTVRNGPDLARIHAIRPDERLRERASCVLGYVGTLGYHDGLDYLLRSLATLVDELGAVDLRCYVMGDGEALPGLRLQAKDLGLDDVVTFTGWLGDDDLRRHLSSIDIGVVPDPSNPYNDRSTMIKVAEYMAVGKPLVAFDLPEHRVTAGDAALYATPNDERDFALKLKELIDAPGLREAMGVYAIERVHECLDWRYSAAWLLEAYAKLNAVPQLEGQARASTGRP